MKVKSSAFEAGQPIPKKYSGDGEDISPPLTVSDIPKGTKSLAIIVDDPDAPSGTFVHWVAWNLPVEGSLPEGMEVQHQGKNHFDDLQYRGPYPPPGPVHHYHFKVYAVDTTLSIADGATKEQLQHALANHILAQAELIGTFKRSK